MLSSRKENVHNSVRHREKSAVMVGRVVYHTTHGRIIAPSPPTPINQAQIASAYPLRAHVRAETTRHRVVAVRGIGGGLVERVEEGGEGDIVALRKEVSAVVMRTRKGGRTSFSVSG